MYDGKFYEVLEGDMNTVRRIKRSGELDKFKFKEVDSNDLVIDNLYLNEKGAIVKFMADGVYEVVNKSPLHIYDNISTLKDSQLGLFWTLVKNCENGTYHGI